MKNQMRETMAMWDIARTMMDIARTMMAIARGMEARDQYHWEL